MKQLSLIVAKPARCGTTRIIPHIGWEEKPGVSSNGFELIMGKT